MRGNGPSRSGFIAALGVEAHEINFGLGSVGRRAALQGFNPFFAASML
jgi:hypothetical protein